MAGGLAAVMLLGVVWPWVGMLGLRASLRFESRQTREGDRVTATLTVANRMPWPGWGLVLERGFAPVFEKSRLEAAVEPADVALARVSGFSRCDFCWEFVPSCRGEYPLAGPRLSTAFPFGLWKRSRPVAVESRLLVWPRIVPLPALPLAHGASWTLGALSDARSGQAGDVIGARPYRPGDMLRHVHWAQTARQGQLIVCERQACLTSSVLVVIDGAADSHVGSGPGCSLEWTLRIAASVCHAFLEHGTRLRVQLGECLFVVEPGGAGLRKLNDALARFQPSRRATASAELRRLARRPAVGARSRRSNSSQLIIVVTTDRGAPVWSQGAERDRRLIVLHGTAIGAHDKAARQAVEGEWFALSLSGDVAAQLCHHWEKVCRDEWRAVQ